MTQQTRPLLGRRPPVVLAGGSQYVRDQVARACAAAGVSPHFVPSLANALVLDPVVLLVVPDQQVEGVSGHRDIIVVGTADDEQRAWVTAAGLASSSVVVLPQGAGWLAEYVGRRLNPAAAGTVVGVLGAAGGCGVSTLAYWCARSAADRGSGVMLIDGQPLGGGLDLALGLEGRPGVRWKDLADIRGTLSAEQFAAALPVHNGVALLSHGAAEHWAGAAGADPGEMSMEGVRRADGPGEDAMRRAGVVIDAARGAFDLTFVDLGQAAGADRALAATCDHLVLLMSARPRSVASAPLILRAFGSRPITVVLRGPVVDGLDAWRVAELLACPGPLPLLPSSRGAARAEATGCMSDLAVPRRARRVIDRIGVAWEQAR